MAHYDPPGARIGDPVQRSLAGPVRNGATTGFGVTFLVLGGIGVGIGLLGVAAVLAVDSPESLGLSRNELAGDALLSLLSKVGLVVTGLTLLIRARPAAGVAAGSLGVSLLHSLYAISITLAPQTAAADTDAQRLGLYFGAIAVAAFSASLYVAVLVYLRGERARAEFRPARWNAPGAF